MKNLLTDDTNGDGEINKNDGHNKHTYNLPALVTTLIGAFQQHVENGGEDGGNVDLSAYATKKYVDDAIDDIEVPDLSDYATKKYVDDAIKAIELETGTSIKNIYIDSSNNLMFLLSDGTVINAGKLPSGGGSSYRIIDLPNPDWTTTLTNCFQGALIAEPEMDSDGDGQFTFIKPHIEKIDYRTNHYIEFAVHAANYQNIDDARIYYKGHGMGNDYPTFCPAPGFATDLGAPAKYLGADIDDEYGHPWENVYASKGHFDKIYVNQILTPDGSDSGNGSGGIGDTLDTLTVRKIKGPEPEKEGQYNRVDFEDGIGVTHIFCNSEDENNTIFIGSYLSLHAGMHVFDDISLDEGGAIKFPDGTRLTSAKDASGNGSIVYTKGIEYSLPPGIPSAPGIHYTNPGLRFFYTYGYIVDNNNYQKQVSIPNVEIMGNTTILGDLDVPPGLGSIIGNLISPSDESLKENIRYLDSETTPDVGEGGEQPDFLVKADLHDFIINQINLCEYNFIDDDSPKIGFIADEYEGTKVGDKIVSSHELEEHDDNGEVIETTKTLAYDVNNLLFATIGALQEEVRIKDEKIASLEARLARIEEMLNNNN
jgi:hypothetical protein